MVATVATGHSQEIWPPTRHPVSSGMTTGAVRTSAGRGWVKLSEQIAFLLSRGSVTYLHAPAWDAIVRRDEIAGRLWSFHEAESLLTVRRYQLFASAPGRVAEEGNLPAIAELLRLDWSVRSQIAKRVRRALAVIGSVDSRYQLSLIKGRLPACGAPRQAAASIRRGRSRDHSLLRSWRPGGSPTTHAARPGSRSRSSAS